MHLQARDPYYFSPFGVEAKLRSYSLVGARISSPHCSPYFLSYMFQISHSFFCKTVYSVEVHFCSRTVNYARE